MKTIAASENIAGKMVMPRNMVSYMLSALSGECIAMADYVLILLALIASAKGTVPTPLIMIMIFQLFYNVKNGLCSGSFGALFGPDGTALATGGVVDACLIWPILSIYVAAFFGCYLP